MENDRASAVLLGPHAPDGTVVLFNAIQRQTEQGTIDSRHICRCVLWKSDQSLRFSENFGLLPTRVRVGCYKAQRSFIFWSLA